MVDKLDVDRALARAVRVAACVVTKAAGAVPLSGVMNPSSQGVEHPEQGHFIHRAPNHS